MRIKEHFLSEMSSKVKFTWKCPCEVHVLCEKFFHLHFTSIFHMNFMQLNQCEIHMKNKLWNSCEVSFMWVLPVAILFVYRHCCCGWAAFGRRLTPRLPAGTDADQNPLPQSEGEEASLWRGGLWVSSIWYFVWGRLWVVWGYNLGSIVGNMIIWYYDTGRILSNFTLQLCWFKVYRIEVNYAVHCSVEEIVHVMVKNVEITCIVSKNIIV